jgi:hypothetical protein
MSYSKTLVYTARWIWRHVEVCFPKEIMIFMDGMSLLSEVNFKFVSGKICAAKSNVLVIQCRRQFHQQLQRCQIRRQIRLAKKCGNFTWNNKNATHRFWSKTMNSR